MYVVVNDNGKVFGPFMSLDKARQEASFVQGRVYLLQGPV